VAQSAACWIRLGKNKSGTSAGIERAGLTDLLPLRPNIDVPTACTAFGADENLSGRASDSENLQHLSWQGSDFDHPGRSRSKRLTTDVFAPLAAHDNSKGNYNLGSCTVYARSGVDRQLSSAL
jgi:hypothetical protein